MAEAIHIHAGYPGHSEDVHKVRCERCGAWEEVGPDRFHETGSWVMKAFLCKECRKEE